MKLRKQHAGSINLASGVGRTRKRWQPWMKWTVVGFGAVVVIIGLTAVIYMPRAKKAYADGMEAVTVAKKIPDDLAQQKFDQAREHVTEFQAKLAIAKTDVERMQGLRWWPYVGKQYRAVETLVLVGEDGGAALGTLVDFLDEVFAPFREKGKVNLASISRTEKGQLLANIAEKGEELREAQVKIEQATARIDGISTKGLIGPLADAIGPIKDQIPMITQAISEAVPATKVFPAILGYPTSKTYLFLLENNGELRPGGGFIGTYGLMNMTSGEIASLKTDNVYNHDKAADKMPNIPPPEPISRLLKVDTWYFRDSNWSPDFPTSAAQALNLYQREGGSKNVDGVIAVTPTAIARMISLVGSIKVDGIEFTEENFVDRLQYQVEKGYAKAGIDDADRKDIIGDMTSILVKRILELPLTKWKDLFLTLSEQLDQKQVLFYMNNENIQNILVAQNWGGAIDQRPETDYIMVVDANLASLKTDQVMLRRYSYNVAPDGESAIATLTVHYQNTGKFDWKTTRYNTFVRVYVPNGSELIESSGAQLKPMSNAAGKVETSTELGKTVFSTFKSIEPGTQSDLVLKYRLPKKTIMQWESGNYSLVWQKQPGMMAPDMSLNITAKKNVKNISGVDNLGRVSKDTATFSGRLDRDRNIVITTEK